MKKFIAEHYMKVLGLITILLYSCSTPGQETVKISNTLTVVTEPLLNTNYPEYKSGDSVIVWRSYGSKYWFLETHDDQIYESSLICYKKGIIIK